MTLSYDDLVTAATVGITRKPLALTELDGPAGYDGVLDADDPAAALLDAAALLTVARRAGVQPRRGVAVPAPPADSEPTLPTGAVEKLMTLRWPKPYGSVRDNNDLITELLNAAADAGYVATGQLLTTLLDAATYEPALRQAVTGVLGTRGRRVAQYRPEWRDSVAAADALQDPETWRTGVPAARLGYLSGLRDRDPGAARDLLSATWAGEHGRDRARFIAVLARGLSPADEEFLETALRDRAATVRTQALRVLARLPGSAFCHRMSERTAGLVGLEGTGPSRRLVITLPGKPDAAAVRDGIGGSPPVTTIGDGAWRLTQMLAATPLWDWTTRFRLSPSEIAALPVEGNLHADVHAGWRLAAVNQDDGEWAQALLDAGNPEDSGGRPPEAWPPDRVVAAALPQEVRAARVAALLTEVSMSSPYDPGLRDDMPDEVATYPSPWPPALADAAIAALDREMARLLEQPDHWRSVRYLAWKLLEVAGRCMPPTGDRDYAAELMRHSDASQSRSYYFRSAAQTIILRRAFYEEIS